jgi:hypothetical protein
MAKIVISNLYSAGSEFFSETESFLNELADEQENLIYGGYGDDRISQSVPFCPVGPKSIVQSKAVSLHLTPPNIRP